MADHADDDDNGNIFIYRGGHAPLHVTHVLIDESVDEIKDRAFMFCTHLLTVDTHDGIRKIGKRAFSSCRSLRRLNLKSVIEIDDYAFDECENLESVEFGDYLETFGHAAFSQCTSLTHLKLPSIITVGYSAFFDCTRLADIELPEHLETIRRSAFCNCERLQRIAIPLKRDLFEFSDTFHRYTQFDECVELATVDLVGGIHKTVASLHMDSWRAEMIAEIDRINQVLSNTIASEKGGEVRQWIQSVIDKLDYYKEEHCRYVKEGTTLLELVLWKAKLGEKEYNWEEGRTKKAKVDDESVRKESRMLCGADVVIKNVLPFLQLE